MKVIPILLAILLLGWFFLATPREYRENRNFFTPYITLSQVGGSHISWYGVFATISSQGETDTVFIFPNSCRNASITWSIDGSNSQTSLEMCNVHGFLYTRLPVIPSLP